MSEEQIKVIYNIIERTDWNVDQLIATACLMVMCGNFIACKTQKYAGIRLGAVYFCVYMGLFWIPGWGGYRVSVIALAAVFVIWQIMDKSRVRSKIFLLSAFLTIRWMLGSIAYTTAYYPWIYTWEKVEQTVGYESRRILIYYYLIHCGQIILRWIISGVPMYIIARTIRKIFKPRDEDISVQELIILMIPIANGMIVHRILRIYYDIYNKATGGNILLSHSLADCLWIIYYIVIMVSLIGLIVMLDKIKTRQEEEHALLMLENEIRDMQAHISEVERLYADIRSVKHDIRNHMEVIDSLLAQGKADEAKEYAGNLTETVEAFEFPIRTGNPVTDVIIYEKMNLAMEKGINFSSDFHYPEDTEINAFDLSVILSNALSNAIEASDTGGNIRLSSYRNKNIYLIEVANTFNKILNFDATSGLPGTDKRDKRAHGYGLKNIKTVAAKYYGDARMEQSDQDVILTVMLQTVT